MAQHFLVEIEVPGDLEDFKLPEGVVFKSCWIVKIGEKSFPGLRGWRRKGW